MEPIETIAIVVLIPGLTALVVALVGRRHPQTGAIALSCGALAGAWFLLGHPTFWPIEVTDRFGHVIVAGLVASLIGSALGKRARWLVYGASGLAVAAMFVGPLFSHRFSGTAGPMVLLGGAFAIAVVSSSIELSCSNDDRFALAPAMVVLAAASVAAGISGSLTLAQLGGVVTAALGGAWAMTLRTNRKWTASIAPVLGCALVAIVMLSSLYSSMGLTTALALLAAPIASAVVARTLTGPKSRWAPIAAALLFTGFALAPPLFAGEARTTDVEVDDDYGYE